MTTGINPIFDSKPASSVSLARAGFASHGFDYARTFTRRSRLTRWRGDAGPWHHARAVADLSMLTREQAGREEKREREKKNIRQPKHERCRSPSGAFAYFHAPRVRAMRARDGRRGRCAKRFRLLRVRHHQVQVSGMLHRRLHQTRLRQ